VEDRKFTVNGMVWGGMVFAFALGVVLCVIADRYSEGKPVPVKAVIALTPQQEFEAAERRYGQARVNTLTDHAVTENMAIADNRVNRWSDVVFTLAPRGWLRTQAYYLSLEYVRDGEVYPVSWGVGTYQGRPFEWLGYMSGKGALMIKLSAPDIPGVKMPESRQTEWQGEYCTHPENTPCDAAGAFELYVLTAAKKLKGFTFDKRGEFPDPPSH
jgi:hypothetical protein